MKPGLGKFVIIFFISLLTCWEVKWPTGEK